MKGLDSVATGVVVATKSLATDCTGYARSIGYIGVKPVRVLDGKVVSHRSADWFKFCEGLKAGREGVRT